MSITLPFLSVVLFLGCDPPLWGTRTLTADCRYAVSKFKREGIRLLTQHHVERVEAVRSPTMVCFAS